MTDIELAEKKQDDELERLEEYGNWFYEEVVVQDLEDIFNGIHDGCLETFAREMFVRGAWTALDRVELEKYKGV